VLLRSTAAKQSFDLAIIDKSLPSYEEKSISSGSDLAETDTRNDAVVKLL
jgi:hypothetical protein